MGRRIGFVSTRFAGTDGVSLESAKWAQVLWHYEHFSFWYGGRLDRDPNASMVVPEACFAHPDNVWINQRVFGHSTREPEVTRRIYEQSEHLKDTLYEFVKRFEIDILIVENALCIPMHVPLGVALTHFITETGIPTIAHHHDFYWERTRFSVNAINDILDMAFPPTSTAIQHVTINTLAQEQLAMRKGDSSILIPNVLDFEQPPPDPDAYADEFRRDLGLAPDDIIFLQPTRVVPRKGIEHSIGLITRLGDPRCKLIVTHQSGDEGGEYLQDLQEMAEQEGVDLRFVYTHVAEARSVDADGRRCYTLADAYSQADFITYPSLYEGFGNALLEAFYYRKPVLVNRYAIFVSDIEPKGFRTITMDGFLTRDVVQQVRHVIADPDFRREMVDYNYELCKAFFSYTVLRRRLRVLITNITGMENL
ncbi:MAG: glycosyltransferase family 4 protein [Pirellulales bacterium]|jgi:glycosyltransferase involved in cell wall biosynthesis|nr:glycosyltransferase family 4 protein [Thermoguttaceae bacterium]MDD4787671.1 glycosyltransferase family 4 protein [Pirellulales bacterium]MDI9442780.1 glycosyltransferase family 4 protein [Planctomycetota bacterium]